MAGELRGLYCDECQDLSSVSSPSLSIDNNWQYYYHIIINFLLNSYHIRILCAKDMMDIFHIKLEMCGKAQRDSPILVLWCHLANMTE